MFEIEFIDIGKEIIVYLIDVFCIFSVFILISM